MVGKNPHVDAYIRKAQPFARPILTHLRKLVHQACPDAKENIRWGSPFFDHDGMMCFMAAFTEHAVFGFWKGKLLFGKEHKGAMGHFGRLTSVKDLPSDKRLIGYIKKAAELNERGLQRKRPARGSQKVSVPADLKAALGKNAKAKKTFENFSYSHKKEYVDWIADAKREETRKARLKKTIQWLAAGRPQNWRYM